ncbi:hypothetical protein WCT83_23320, partial [Pectobacterium parmentieri]
LKIRKSQKVCGTKTGVLTEPLGLKCTHSAKNPKQAHAAIKDKWGQSMSKRDMRELQNTVDRIKLNKPHYSNDGTTFDNFYKKAIRIVRGLIPEVGHIKSGL